MADNFTKQVTHWHILAPLRRFPLIFLPQHSHLRRGCGRKRIIDSVHWNELIIEIMNYEGVCRKAPAKWGLLINIVGS